ncbi:MAG: hypothetical protein COX52_04910 [Syntrophobacterales bacterium CG23_combo_of_CG06-09_8_20_14_all_48_27]|nr:MAG: hypothetical protein COX52_04910 [Syntrophobacterales bacterium CG23_combo_of_CG06-09_8_20_14_all_48_27]
MRNVTVQPLDVKKYYAAIGISLFFSGACSAWGRTSANHRINYGNIPKKPHFEPYNPLFDSKKRLLRKNGAFWDCLLEKFPIPLLAHQSFFG